MLNQNNREWRANRIDVLRAREIETAFAQRIATVPDRFREQSPEPGSRDALLHGLESRLQHETGMPIVVARDPLNCVAVGSGQCLEEFEALKRVLITTSAR